VDARNIMWTDSHAKDFTAFCEESERRVMRIAAMVSTRERSIFLGSLWSFNIMVACKPSTNRVHQILAQFKSYKLRRFQTFPGSRKVSNGRGSLLWLALPEKVSLARTNDLYIYLLFRTWQQTKRFSSPAAHSR
jgi:hypothetical protein